MEGITMSDTTTQDTAVVETSDDSTSTEAAATSATETIEGYDSLGEPGKKALDRMKAERDAAIAAAKDAKGDPSAAARIKAEREELAATKLALAELKAKAEGKEAEFAAQQEAQRIKDEALSLANTRIVGAELRAAAKGKVTDEALADLSLYIKPADFEVGSDGEVDASAISAAIDDLIARKPYLAAQGKRFQGTADGGARNDATKPSQLTKADVDRLTSERKYDEIEKARLDGRLADYLAS